MKRHALHLALLACLGLAACHATRPAAPVAVAEADSDAARARAGDPSARQE